MAGIIAESRTPFGLPLRRPLIGFIGLANASRVRYCEPNIELSSRVEHYSSDTFRQRIMWTYGLAQTSWGVGFDDFVPRRHRLVTDTWWNLARTAP